MRTLLVYLLTTVIILNLVGLIPSAFSAPQELPRTETLYYNAIFSPITHVNFLATGGPDLPGLFEPLFVFDSLNFKLIPWIAESYEWKNLSLIVKLRAEAAWWDGTPITSEDVKYTFELGKKHPEITVASLENIWVYVSSIETPDAKTVVFNLRPDNPVKLVMNSILTTSPILCEKFWSQIEKQYSDLTEFKGLGILSSGPYNVTYFDSDKVILQRVDSWWGASIFGRPAPKYLVGLNVRSNEFGNSLLMKGDLDWSQIFMPEVWKLRPDVVTWYSHEPWLMPTPDRTGGFEVNLNHYPLNLPEFRHAIAFAIDVSEISTKAFSHYAVPIDPSFVREDSPFRKYVNESAVKDYGFTYNVDEAKRRLDALNFIDRDGDGVRETPNGTKLSFTIVVVDGWTDWQMACAVFKENMKAIGINIEVRAMDEPSWEDAIIRGAFDFKPAQYDAWTATGVWDFYRTVLDSRIPEWPMLEGKCSRYKNPEAEKLIDEIGATTDEGELKELWGKLTMIMARDMPIIPAWSWGGIGIYNTKYWVGWPTEDNPYPPAEPGWYYENLLTLIHVRPSGTAPVTVSVPPELTELPEKFTELETSVINLSNRVNAIGSSVQSLSSEISSLSTTLMIILGVQIITLIVAIVALIRAGRKEE
jgi:peptide/nickel transport system substrate-binding protein